MYKNPPQVPDMVLAPISPKFKQRICEDGDDAWAGRQFRYGTERRPDIEEPTSHTPVGLFPNQQHPGSQLRRLPPHGRWRSPGRQATCHIASNRASAGIPNGFSNRSASHIDSRGGGGQ